VAISVLCICVNADWFVCLTIYSCHACCDYVCDVCCVIIYGEFWLFVFMVGLFWLVILSWLPPLTPVCVGVWLLGCSMLYDVILFCTRCLCFMFV